MRRTGQFVKVLQTEKEGEISVRIEQFSKTGTMFLGTRADDLAGNSNWYMVKDIVKDE